LIEINYINHFRPKVYPVHTRDLGCAQELKPMRAASAIATPVLFVMAVLTAAAHADIVRRNTFPIVLLGTWAEKAEQCATKDKSNVLIDPANYGDGSGSCAVRWIAETAGARGTNYAVHALCTSASQPNKTQTVNIIIQPQSDGRAVMGRSFDNLKTYVRCPGT
jgi:hypothetical protein